MLKVESWTSGLLALAGSVGERLGAVSFEQPLHRSGAIERFLVAVAVNQDLAPGRGKRAIDPAGRLQSIDHAGFPPSRLPLRGLAGRPFRCG